MNILYIIILLITIQLDSQVLNEKECKSLLPNCMECSSRTYKFSSEIDCIDCLKYYKPWNGKCVVKNCKTFEDDSHNICSICHNGFSKDKGNLCKAINCETWDDDEEYCATCKDNHSLIYGKNGEANCPVKNCWHKHDNSSVCGRCHYGFILNDKNDACTKCYNYDTTYCDGTDTPKPCFVDILKCKQCFLMKNTRVKCQKCYQNYAIVDDECKEVCELQKVYTKKGCSVCLPHLKDQCIPALMLVTIIIIILTFTYIYIILYLTVIYDAGTSIQVQKRSKKYLEINRINYTIYDNVV